MKKIFTPFITVLLFSTALKAQWADYQQAELVIGQPNFTSYFSARTSSGLDGPWSVAIDFQNSKFYVGDFSNHRVLRYAYPPVGNQPTAELVFGQSDFISDPGQTFFNNTGSWPAPTAKQILNPISLAVYNGDLWVADGGNCRVVKYSQAYNREVNNPDADLVIGQSTFTTRNYTCSINSLYNPYGLTIDGSGNLWVADAGNGRVLRFNNASSLVNGASANGVLGQSDFNSGALPTTASQNNFGLPSSICFDGTTAWVSDHWFHRVLRFDNAAAKPDGANADAVLGQTDFTGNTPGTTPNTFNKPFGVCTDGIGNLYVSDQTNNRIAIYLNAAHKLNGANANIVLGQASLWSNAYTYGSNSFAPGSVKNMAIDKARGKLFVTDLVASRVLQFPASTPLTGIDEVASNISGITNPFRLSVNPNPIQTKADFNFRIPVSGYFSMRIYNAQGTEVAVLINKTMQAGEYTFEWYTEKLPDGIYFCRLLEGKYAETGKLVLLK